MESEDAYIDVDGLLTRYLDQGSGRAVLLLHGASLGSSADVYRRNLEPLAERGLRVIALDQPGFGLTANPTDHSRAYRTEFIVKFMDALGLGEAALVGHSQAGGLALELACAQPGRVSKVVVLGTGSLLPPLPDKSAEKKPKTPAEGREGTEAEPTLAQTRQLLESNLYHTDLVNDDVVELRHARSTGKNFEAFVERGKASARRGRRMSWRELVDCPVPLLMMYGREDRAHAAQRVSLLEERCPQLDIQLLEHCKHLVQWDAADSFERLAGDFLAA